ncbi:uncharacterized protein LOC135164373 [Diachasmimorpha longicaudata]|uniref:uncharacterized protein LOC135164373 n=1 Tax=Diachasmimorpha longicaudata TaxID=58733 RepID=UPI0030B8B364
MKKKNEKMVLLLVFGLILHEHRVMGFLPGLNIIYDLFDKLNAIHDVHSKFTTPSTADLMNATQELSGKIDKLATQITAHIDRAVQTLLTRLPLIGEITDDVRVLNNYVGRVDNFYNELKIYVTHPQWYTERDLRDLLSVFISRESGNVFDVISQLNALIVPGRLGVMKKSLFVLLGEQTGGTNVDMCDTYGPPQQRLLDLYDIVVETEVRAFLVVGFAYVLQGDLNKENSTGALERARFSYVERVKRYEAVVREGMRKSSRMFRRCDPPSGWIRDENFVELEIYRRGSPLYAVSLRSMEADLERNMVVTGIAFTKKNAIISLKVETAQLNISGHILDETAVWLEPEDIKYDSEQERFMLNDPNGDSIEMKLNKDIAVLSGSEKRIHLDKLSLSSDEMITGVRFRRLLQDHMKPLQLELRSTRVDYDKGILIKDSNKWIGKGELDYSGGERRWEYKSDDYKGPDKDMPQTSINVEPLKFINFDWSKSTWDGSKVAIPLFDGVPVNSAPRTPLTSIGLYHKKAEGYGGFLTFILEGFDKSNYDLDASGNRNIKT